MEKIYKDPPDDKHEYYRGGCHYSPTNYAWWIHEKEGPDHCTCKPCPAVKGGGLEIPKSLEKYIIKDK